MYSNNKGSILIFTLIIFSIISMITMMCIGLNYSNKTIFNLEYKEMKMIEDALSGIEVANSNILKEVSTSLNNANNEDEFKDYFLGNDFSNNVRDMSEISLDNVEIEITSNRKFDEEGICKFKITSTFYENSYTRKFQANAEIKNPFLRYENNVNNEDNGQESDLDKENYFNEIKESIDINGLVRVYNYKEI